MNIRKIFMILLFLTLSCAAKQDIKKPFWIERIQDSKGSVYFKGVSGYYLSKYAYAKEKSKREACNKAFAELASYIGIRQKSVQFSSMTLEGGSVEQKAESETIGMTDLILFGIKPYKTYREYNDDRSNLRTWCLIKLDKAAEMNIRAEISKEKKGYEKKMEEILQAIDQQNFEKAKTLLSVAKGYRVSKFDDRLITLENRLSNILKDIFSVDLQINKQDFNPGEKIDLNVSVSKDAFVYIFYNNGMDYELVFPNKLMSANKIKKGNLISLPNEFMIDEGVFITAYEDLKDNAGKFFTVASFDNLFIEKHSSDDAGDFLLFEAGGRWRKKIKKCLHKKTCVSTKASFKILTESRAMIVFDINIIYDDLKIKKITENSLKQSLKKKGYKTGDGSAKYLLEVGIEKKKEWSPQLGIDITIINLAVTATRKGDNDIIAEYSKSKQLTGDSANQINSVIQKMLNAMVVSLDVTIKREVKNKTNE